MIIMATGPAPQLVRGLYPEIGTTGALVGQQDFLLSGDLLALSNPPQFVNQITVEESHHDEMEIVDHPIEQGAPITDHAFKKPSELTLTIGWTGAQLFVDGIVNKNTDQQAYLNALSTIYGQLLNGQASRTLYTVVTGKRIYSQMLIKSLATQSDKEHENILMITVHMRQILLAFAQDVSVAGPQSAQRFPTTTNPDRQQGRQQLNNGSQFNTTQYEEFAG